MQWPRGVHEHGGRFVLRDGDLGEHVAELQFRAKKCACVVVPCAA